jgi:pyruvate/2-oxoglutarate dehydrogenase complex dihydrolipoamide dehydrogenase (E3) component
MASYFNSAGSKVTVVEMLDHIAGDTDSDISRILQAKDQIITRKTRSGEHNDK